MNKNLLFATSTISFGILSSFLAQSAIHRQPIFIYYATADKNIEVGIETHSCDRRIVLADGDKTDHYTLIHGKECVARRGGDGWGPINEGSALDTIECIADLPPIIDYTNGERDDLVGDVNNCI
ncbi:hypothetical protein [Thalassotalea hakodatensis]|uniref:hypothetical protein n=1 Tax=Thalassotalea hakodatensis TaxID=3030492 RepID=UPI0025731F46|nr:hypothetical protein [Thalassotalea hakodatensis]